MNKRRGKGKMVPLEVDAFNAKPKDSQITSEKDINYQKP